MPSLNLMIKPVSSNCNMKCKYCFYHDLASNRERASYGKMDEKLLELIVKKAFTEAEGSVSFSFQGGEPTLAGLDFYKTFMDYLKKYNKDNIDVNLALQTNGIKIDQKWAAFLSENDWLVGLSIDGYKDLHNYFRIDRIEEGTYKQVIKTSELFKKCNVDFNVLTVITDQLARHGKKVYNSYKKHNFKFLQFIRCLEPLDGKKEKYSLTPENYELFLNNIFNEWYQDIKKGNYISIRFFDNVVRMLMGRKPEACEMKGHCSFQNIIESDGSIYPCDFYVVDEWKLGNIKNMSFTEVYESKKAKAFIKESTDLPKKCEQCKWLKLCRNGCKRNRDENNLNNYCTSFYNFYEKNINKLLELKRIFLNN
ncbi:MAG TPA: anaerobic sulfatase maturase [Halanaerobiales bacterium]|nr:anaerobic sulfatase maturase [Halanaerobiales bacterium]